MLKGAITVALALTCSVQADAQIKVIMSGGFATPYRMLAPEFERATSITITTGSGASQGSGPETIAAQIRRGVQADVVILSREGLDDLIAADAIIPGTDVNLAQTPVGVAVPTGAPKPDVSTVSALTRTLLATRSIAVAGSTSGIYLTTRILPRLGVPSNAVTITARGAEAASLVAARKTDLALLPVSEILHVPGVDLVDVIPSEVQFISVFSAAVVKGSKAVEVSQKLIAYLASERALAALKDAGMEPVPHLR